MRTKGNESVWEAAIGPISVGLSSHDDKGELRNETEVVVAGREGAPPPIYIASS